MTEDQISDALMDFIEQVLWEVIDLFLIPRFHQSGYQGKTLNATGEWLDSLHAKGNVIRGRRYTEQLEYGRRPYPNQPESWVPINVLREWVRVKLGLTGENAERAAWAIRHKISTEGSEIYRRGGNDLMDVLQEEECVEYIRERLGIFFKGQLQLYVSQQIRESFNN